MICDHQFYSSDETDWIFSTSATSLLGGSTTAKRILQELFRKRHNHMIKKSEKIKRKKRAVTTESTSLITSDWNPSSPGKRFPETKSWSEPLGEGGEDLLIIRNRQGISNFENFDESQHLNGCPVKWLYNKRLSDRNKKYKISRWCSKKSAEKNESKKGKSQLFRDKTPVEVKIHKINLIDKCMCKSDENHFPPFKPSSSSSSSCSIDKSAILEPLESHRKKLAARLNWKLHDETAEDDGLETSSEISSRQNYLPPRPLLGLKPLLSILLSPHQEICCNVATHFLQNSNRERKTESPSLSVQSLDLPSFMPESRSSPKTTNTSRWGSKSSRLQKKLQIPNQITMNLRQVTEIPKGKTDSNNLLQGRKITSKLPKCQPSLSSLFYELSDKTKNVQPLEDLIKDLMMEDDQFKIKRFLRHNCETNILGPMNEHERNQEKKMRTTENDSTTTSTDEIGLDLICHGVRLSTKTSQPKRTTQRERYASVRINS